MDAGLTGLTVSGLPEPDERRRILNDAKVVCNRARLLIDALDAWAGFQSDQSVSAIPAQMAHSMDSPPQGTTYQFNPGA